MNRRTIALLLLTVVLTLLLSAVPVLAQEGGDPASGVIFEPATVQLWIPDLSIFEVVFLSIVARSVTEAFLKPVKDRLKAKDPAPDISWMWYIGAAVGCVIGWFSGLNLFTFAEGLIGVPGRIATAAMVGAGAPVINDIFQALKDWKLPAKQA